MLASYTRAINKQNNTTGSLFRQKTKTECLNCPGGIAPPFFTVDGVTRINIELPEKQYPQVCFNYIHLNPVKAGLVNKPEDWEFSSAADYAALRKSNLTSTEIAALYVNTTVK